MADILNTLRTRHQTTPTSPNNQLNLAQALINQTVPQPDHAHTRQRTNRFFLDFYGSYDYNTDYNSDNSTHLYGLFPSDYDTNLVAAANDSLALGYKSDTSFINGLSAPLLYILCMLSLYLIIICVAFMSALYSHRKRVGYNYDEDGFTSQSDESSDEHHLLSPEHENLNSNISESIEMLETLNIENETNNYVYEEQLNECTNPGSKIVEDEKSKFGKFFMTYMNEA